MTAVYSQGKNPIQLRERDFRIFQLLCSDGAKTSSDLAKRFWDGKSLKAHAACQRIRKLIAAGLLERGNPKFLYLSEHARRLMGQQNTGQGVEAKSGG